MKSKQRLAVLSAAAVLVNALVLPAAVHADVNEEAAVVSSAPDAAAAESDAAAGSSGAAEGAPAEDEPQGDMVMPKEEAEEMARKLAQIPEDYALRNAGYGDELLANGKRAVWELYFVREQNNKTNASVSVRLNADNGKLLSFDAWDDDPNEKPSYPLKVEREEAKEIALAYIERMAPEYAEEIVFNEDYGAQLLPPLTGEVRHTLRFDRTVNGILFMDNGITVEVDSEGYVVSCSVDWDETIVFPKVETKLEAYDAMAKLTAIAKPELVYMLPYEAADKSKPILGFVMESAAIDAVTGEPIQEGAAGETVASEPVSPEKLGERAEGAAMTEAQAKQKVEELFGLPAASELTDSSYNEYVDDYTGRKRTAWNLYWTVKEGGKEIREYHASVDSGSGTVYSYYSYNSNDSDEEDAKPKVSYEKAKSLAADAVKKLLPWAADSLYLVSNSRYEADEDGEFRSYPVSFKHKVNGATVSYDEVTVRIDAQTGEVTSFDAVLADVDYGSGLPEVISDNIALGKWLGYYRTVLTYDLARQYLLDGQPISDQKYKVMAAAGEWTGDRVERRTEAKLVYRLIARPLDESVFLSAETGEWINSSTGEVTQLNKPKADDIEGHWAENELSLMVAYKALDLKDGNVRPNETITRGELIKMLVLAMNEGHMPYEFSKGEAGVSASFADVAADSGFYKYVETALAENLIDIGDGSFNPEGKVNREEMAELIVRALGYNPLANYEGLFRTTFSDSASVERKGQAAIVVGLGIMSLNDGKFEPDRLVTRAEAAAAFFRYLQVRADLKEAPLRD